MKIEIPIFIVRYKPQSKVSIRFKFTYYSGSQTLIPPLFVFYKFTKQFNLSQHKEKNGCVDAATCSLGIVSVTGFAN